MTGKLLKLTLTKSIGAYMVKCIKTFIKTKSIIYKYGNIGLLIFILALFSNCSDKKEKLYTETIDGLFDTTHILTGYARSEKDFKKKCFRL